MCNELEILEGWDERILYDLAEYHNGAAFKPKDWVEDGLPIVRIEQINKPNSETDKFNGFVLPRNLIDTGDLIFSWSATLKVIIWSGGPAVLNQHLYKVVPNSGVNKQLLLQILDFNMEKLAGQSQGSTMKHVTRKELTKFRVKFPLNENEQEKIAIILRTVDEAIEKTEALIDKYGLVKAGMMHDLLTRGLTPGGKLRPPREEAPDLYKETPIGWIPKEWEFKTIDECANIHNNLRLPLSSEVREGMRGDYPYYGPTGIVGFINEFRADGTYVLIGEDGDHFLKYSYKKMTQKVVGKFNVNNHAHVLSGKDGCSTDWLLYYFLHRDITFWLTRQGAGRYKLNKAALQKLPLALPKPEEQDEIAKHIFFYRNMLDTNGAVLAKLRKQKKGLMHDLLTGEVQVKVNDPEAAHV
ncbi:restriction endonuclease subunit S [Hoeflea ulvae]|uniref:Restriction endonuclease subunit S n=1 Tax=Hoeflea ulvae TaxID=2983764 RepID=A0ABT3YBJ1_9HYPH|nr:restriction endonuclease subunit S [Hoeflea ulvae]MCY0093245.1 restriction endonuclease subunit S [Hoeflea ulvae]